MARQDLRKQITIYPPNGAPGEKHTLLNARDLITHSDWSTTPQHVDQFKAVADILSEANAEPTEEELARQALVAKAVDTMTLEEVRQFAEVEFGTKIDKRLNLNKALDRLQEIADASTYKLKFSTDVADDQDDDQDEDQKSNDQDDDQKSDDQTDEDSDEKGDSEQE